MAKMPAALGKFTRPRPVGALARARLFRALDEAREHPAVWVAGPPGAGKTTLVSTYVIALSRAEPPPALAPLRASGTIALLGGEKLKLTAEECGEIARLRKVHIETPALRELYERTQGWTAGVVLALEQKSPSGSATILPPEATPQVVFDYFAGEIFGRMEPAAQALLLQAAFLPSMAAQRVVELTGTPDAGRGLEELNRSNYFTLRLAQTHPARAGYQFHPLFREFL